MQPRRSPTTSSTGRPSATATSCIDSARRLRRWARASRRRLRRRRRPPDARAPRKRGDDAAPDRWRRPRRVPRGAATWRAAGRPGSPGRRALRRCWRRSAPARRRCEGRSARLRARGHGLHAPRPEACRRRTLRSEPRRRRASCPRRCPCRRRTRCGRACTSAPPSQAAQQRCGVDPRLGAHGEALVARRSRRPRNAVDDFPRRGQAPRRAQRLVGARPSPRSGAARSGRAARPRVDVVRADGLQLAQQRAWHRRSAAGAGRRPAPGSAKPVRCKAPPRSCMSMKRFTCAPPVRARPTRRAARAASRARSC